MKRMVFSLSFLLFVSGMYAQITLEECQRKTQENYPLVHQYGLVEKTKEYNLENAAKGYLPQFALSAKASYQSDVTELPVKIVLFQALPKKDKMEWIIQKAVELGAAEIVPVSSRRCVVRLDDKKKEKKLINGPSSTYHSITTNMEKK